MSAEPIGSTSRLADGQPMSSAPTVVQLTEFFERLGSLEAIVRIILRSAELSAELTLRDGADERTVFMDFTTTPGRITLGKPKQAGTIRIKVDALAMHQVLLGQLHPGEAFGRRAMLLRGAPADLARFLPLFDFAPLLYRDHVAERIGGGSARANRATQAREDDMTPTGERQAALLTGAERRSQRAALRLVERLAFSAGYGIAVLRGRLLPTLSLFDVLGAMARGVNAASPAEQAPEEESQGDAQR